MRLLVVVTVLAECDETVLMKYKNLKFRSLYVTT